MLIQSSSKDREFSLDFSIRELCTHDLSGTEHTVSDYDFSSHWQSKLLHDIKFLPLNPTTVMLIGSLVYSTCHTTSLKSMIFEPCEIVLL